MTEGILPEGIILYALTRDRAIDLWDRLKVYDALWPDETRGDVVKWVEFALAPSTLFLEETNGRAMYILSDVKEGLSANVHAVFFDHNLRSRVDLVKRLVTWAMFEFDLYRLQARIPAFARALRRFLFKIGFRQEGIIRDAFWFKGHLESAIIMSILRDEIGG